MRINVLRFIWLERLRPIKEVMGCQRSHLPLAMDSAIVCGMTIRIDKSGRIVLPKMIRERFGAYSRS
jgi:hypothetical protein